MAIFNSYVKLPEGTLRQAMSEAFSVVDHLGGLGDEGATELAQLSLGEWAHGWWWCLCPPSGHQWWRYYWDLIGLSIVMANPQYDWFIKMEHPKITWMTTMGYPHDLEDLENFQMVKWWLTLTNHEMAPSENVEKWWNMEPSPWNLRWFLSYIIAQSP